MPKRIASVSNLIHLGLVQDVTMFDLDISAVFIRTSLLFSLDSLNASFIVYLSGFSNAVNECRREPGAQIKNPAL